MISNNEALPSHRLAKLFPPINEKQFVLLKADIKKNGQLTDIVTREGQNLDGRSRDRACRELGIRPRSCEYEGSDPLAFVLSCNLHRRHLNPSQLAMVAAQAARQITVTKPGQLQICGLTYGQAAKMFGISLRQVEKAAALIRAVMSAPMLELSSGCMVS